LWETYLEENAMGSDDTKGAWDRFEADIKAVAGELRRHYKDADTSKNAELSRSLEQLGRAADAVFASLETATRDPEVRTRSKQAARSFGSALAETFRELGDQVDKAVRKPGGKK
jgi:hypothetical protein